MLVAILGCQVLGDEISQADHPGPIFGTTVIAVDGFRGTLYTLKRGTKRLPDLSRRSAQVTGQIWTKELNIPPQHWRGGFGKITKRDQWFALSYTAKFWIEAAGRYDFALLSDDGSKLMIDNSLVIDNDCLHPPDTRTGSLALSQGVHEMRVLYFQGLRDCVALLLAVSRPGGTWKVFRGDDYTPPANLGPSYAPGTAKIVSDPDFPSQLNVRDFLTALSANDEREAAIIAHAPPSEGCFMNPGHYCGSR